MQHSVKVFFGDLGCVDLVLFNDYYNHSYYCGQLSRSKDPCRVRRNPGIINKLFDLRLQIFAVGNKH